MLCGLGICIKHTEMKVYGCYDGIDHYFRNFTNCDDKTNTAKPNICFFLC